MIAPPAGRLLSRRRPAPSSARMSTYSISQLARLAGLSRSTLLYYDRLGVLVPRGRTATGYRRYAERDRRRLERICRYRDAGLTLKEIRAVLASGGRPGARLLEQRMVETADRIRGLRHQQRLLAGMLHGIAGGGLPSAVDKRVWVEMLRAAGMDDRAMHQWHREFERRAPEAHHEFLLSLGIPAGEAAGIRRWSRGDGTGD